MDKKKKIIIISSIVAIVVIAIAATLIWYFLINNKENAMSKLNIFYNNLKEKGNYSFIATLDENNKMTYAKNENKAYINTIYDGTKSEFIIKDGNSYLLIEGTKTYYTYTNNETDLNKVEVAIEPLKNMPYEKGKEKVDGKTYEYEEYEGVTSFLMKSLEGQEDKNAKTRFYFKGKELKYIKTIIGDNKELLKVETNYNIDNKMFEIPSDYRGM